jgi:hypothetical protein
LGVKNSHHQAFRRLVTPSAPWYQPLGNTHKRMAASVGTLVRVVGCGQLDRLEIAEAGLENHPVSLLKH